MQYTNISWKNGCPYSEKYDDIYYSSNDDKTMSGEAEFEHVFFQANNLSQRWLNSKDFVIAELGFGSGLNFLLTVYQWLAHLKKTKSQQCLHYIAIEKHPLSPELIRDIISHHPKLIALVDELVSNYPPAVNGTHIRRLFDNKVVIHFKFMEVTQALVGTQHQVDAWYLDGFSPSKNPAMWTAGLFKLMTNNSYQTTTLSTYSAAGFVKRNLQQAGFNVNKQTGFAKKREMLVASFNNKSTQKDYFFKESPWFNLPMVKKYGLKKEVCIIGAGIAGLTLAYSLTHRGYQVTLIDSEGANTTQSSANLAAIVYPRLSVNNATDNEFFVAAYNHTLHCLKSLQQNTREKFWFDEGLLQIKNEEKINKILDNLKLNADFISKKYLSDSVTFEKAITHKETIVNFKKSGVVLPKKLLSTLVLACENNLTIIHSKVDALTYTDQQWHCYKNEKLVHIAPILVLANGTQINHLGLNFNVPVNIVRGQMLELNSNKSSARIKQSLSSDIYISSLINGKHYLGGTYDNNCSLKVNLKDSEKLLKKLNQYYSNIFTLKDCTQQWVGLRTMSHDRVSVVGAVPDEKFYKKEYIDIKLGKTNKKYKTAKYLPNLYISAAHGSRGFTTSFLSAEIISSLINQEPLPVSKAVLNYLSPARFLVKNLKKSTNNN